jgi:hypothetical protein
VFTIRRHSQRPALWGFGRGWRRRLSVIAVIAMATVITRATGATRPEGPRHHRRATGPTGSHARGKWSARKERPRTRRCAIGTLGIERTVHAVVVMVIVMPGDCGTGEEDNRHHENDSCDDHHPRRDLVEARMLGWVRGRSRWRRRRGSRWRLDRRFGCLGHASIMPRQAAAINQLDA